MMMKMKSQLLLLPLVVCLAIRTTTADQCSSIANADKIDCAAGNPAWTVAGCLAKGCCHAEVPGFPACYYPHAHVHEARCTRVVPGTRRDCGDASTTEVSCEAKGCCWELAPGNPYCYYPDNSNPNQPTNPPDTHTDAPDTNPPDAHTDAPDTHPNTPIDGSRWKGRGAKVPFVEIEAEHAHHSGGSIIGNDRHYGKLSSEASGRRAVQLTAVGQYVEFTTPIKCNSIVVRYSLPDSADGKGLDATMDLIVDGKKIKDLPVTSRYSWYYGGYPFNNHPGDTNPHHFYDEVRTFLDKEHPAGTKIRVQVSSTSHSPTFTIDLADFELVGPPKSQPSGSLSVVTYGADPTGKVDSTAAFQKAVNDGRAQKKVVWIPQGHYTLYDHVIVDEVTIAGAGPWYSVLGGRHPTIRSKAVGIYGGYAADGKPSKGVHLRDFAIIGDIGERVDDDQVNAIGGSMSDSSVDNLWLQHVKVGAWFDGPMNGFTMKNTRILDTTADGVNFHIGVTNSVIENCFIRNTGDDGIAIWADKTVSSNNKFLYNTIVVPVLANNIALYGGKDIEVRGNLLTDTISNGGGIHVANRYPNVKGETAVHGTFKIYENTLLRAGNSDFNWQFGVGAIWFSGLNEDIHANIHIKDCDVIDSSYAAISFIEGKTFGVIFENLLINGTGTYAVQIQSDGDALFKNVHAYNVRASTPYFCCNQGFKLSVEGSRAGWWSEKPACGDLHGVQPQWPWNW